LSQQTPNTLLTTSPPSFSEKQAKEIALSKFGKPGTAKVLVSERDQNFFVKTDNGQKFVLKIANAREDPEVIDFQTRALEHIARHSPDLPVPRTVLTADGSEHCIVTDSDGIRHIARLISWLDGIPVADVKVSPALLRDMGATLARLGQALEGFSHPAAGHVLLWDMKNSADLIELLPNIEERAFRMLLKQILVRFRDHVLPRLQSARMQIVHCDLNNGNALADPVNHQKVSGVIDFGDMVHTHLVNDLAIAAAYQLSVWDDPLEASLHLISGYNNVVPLQTVEIALLWDLMLTRLVTSVTICNWRAKQFPENSEYLLIDSEFMRGNLERLSGLEKHEVLLRIETACQMP